MIRSPSYQSILDEHARKIRTLARQTRRDIIEIGKRLAAAKKLLKHGEWQKWLKLEFDWSQATANRFVNVAKRLGDKFVSLTNLPAGALYQLARRDTPDHVRREIRQSAEAGRRIRVSDVVQRIAEAKAKNGASTQRKPITAEDFQSWHRRDVVHLIIDFASRHLPADRSIEEARAVVARADAEGKRERFSEAVAVLNEFVGELQRALNERPALRAIPGGKDESPCASSSPPSSP
jgi:hypothetical protein